MKTITKPKTVIDLGKNLRMFSAVSNVDLESFNIYIYNYEYQRPLSTAYSANQGDKRFSKSSLQTYGPKTKL